MHAPYAGGALRVVCLGVLQDAVEGAGVLVFCTPHQFTRDICRQLRGKVDPSAVAISLTKVGQFPYGPDLQASLVCRQGMCQGNLPKRGSVLLLI